MRSYNMFNTEEHFMNLKMKATFLPNLRLPLSITAAAAALLVFGSARSQTAQAHAQAERKTPATMKDDLAKRSRDIHWPTGFDPEKADLFAHNELVIHAPCERVWQPIIDATICSSRLNWLRSQRSVVQVA